MMDYFDSRQLQEFSMRDVFESEIKSEIDDLLSTETTPFAQETVTNMDLGIGLPPSQDMALEITELQAWDDALSSLTNADIVVSSPNNPQDFFGTNSSDKYGFDSFSSHNNILVNPQTGLPPSHGQSTVGGTHIHAQQVNLFVNSASSQLQQQALLQQQQGLNQNISIPGPRPKLSHNLGLGLEQFSHTNTNNFNNGQLGLRQVRPSQPVTNGRQFTHYQLQNGQGQTLVSQHKMKTNSHKCVQHSIAKAAKHQPYTTSKPHSKKHAKIAKSIKMEPCLYTECQKVYAKPCYSYSCLITMALKNSKAGCLPVSEIYHFMCENFPYFKTAKDGWKNSVRHNLSLNKCFAKVETAVSSIKSGKKGCLWAMNPEKFAKMEEEVHKSTKRDPIGIKMCMAKPEDFPKIEALSRLTHPKNIKDAARIRDSLAAANKQTCRPPSTVISVNASKIPPSVARATPPARVPTPVSLTKVELDNFQQNLSPLGATFLPSDVMSLQNTYNEVFPYDTIEIIPCDNPRMTLSRSASSMSDISPYKDVSQSVNSRILGLDKSPITTLAHTHYSGLEQASRRLEAFL